MALNLKRMVKASYFLPSPPLMCRVSKDLLWNDYFVNRSTFMRKLFGRQLRKELSGNRGIAESGLQMLHVHVLLLPHWVPATWCRRAQTSIRTELPSGKVPTTRVRLRISRLRRSMTLFVRIRVQCPEGKSQKMLNTPMTT